MRTLNAPPKKHKPAPWFESDIPKEKAAVVARLKKMKADNWRALESMTIPELNALQEEAENAAYYIDEHGFVGFDNEHDRTIIEARTAIKNQRLAIKKRKMDRDTEQIKRRNAIFDAANHIRAAVDLIETAQNIERDPTYWANVPPAQLPEIDVSSMTSRELQDAIRECDDELLSGAAPDHRLFAMLETPASQAIAAELKEINEARAARIETARANRRAAVKELDSREIEAAKAAVRKEVLQENLNDVIAELQGRIEELEASK